MEIWKDIKDFESYYQVSSLGNVKSLDRFVNHNFGGMALKKGIMLNKIVDKDGYLTVNLKKKQISYKKRIHVLVCQSFLDNTENKPQVNHINGIKSDNRLENLEWCTLSENRIHAYKTGLQNGLSRRGKLSNFAKLSHENILYIRNNYNKKTLNQYKLALMFNVSQSCISAILNKKNWNYDIS